MASILDKINEITKQVKLQRSTDETLTPNAFLFICGLLEKQKYRPLDIGRQLGLLMVTLIEAPSCAATPEFFDLGQQIVSKISNYKNNSNTSINQNIIISMQRLRVLLPKSQVNDITLRIESISDLVNMWCFWSNCLSINFETSPSASIFRAIYQQTISPLLTTLLSHFVRYFDAPSLIVIADFTSMLCAHVVPSMSQSDKSMVVWHMIQIIRMIWEEFSTSLSKNVRVDFGSASILTSLINRIGPLVVKYSPTLDAILVDLLTEIVTSEPLLHVLSSDTAESRQVRNLANLSLYSIRALTKLQPLLEPSVLKFPLLQSTGVGILSWHMEAAVVHHRVSTLLELLSGSLKESSELIEWLLSQISGRFSEVSAVTDAPCDSTATNTRKDKRKASAEQSEQQSSDPFFDDAPFPEQPKQARTVSRAGVQGGYSLTDSLLVKSSSTSTNRQSNSSTSINQKVPSSTVVSVNQVAETVALVTSQCASNQSIVQQAHLCAWTLVEAAVDPNSLQMLYASQPQHAFNACLLVITAYECVIVALMAYVVNPLTTDILINVQLEAIIHHLTPAYVTSIKFMSQSHNSNSTSIALLSICRVYEVFSSHLRAEKNIEASVKQIRLQLVLIVHESLKDLVPEFKDVLTVKPTRSQVVVKESSCLPASPLFAPLDMLLDSGEISAIGVVLVSNLCLFDISKDQSTISEHDHFLNTLDLSVKKSVIISCVDTVQLLHDTGAVVLNVHQFMSMIQVCIKLSASSNDDCIYIQLLGKLCYMLLEVISLSVDLGNSIISTGASRIIQSIQCNLMLHSSINEAAKQVDGVNVSNSMHTLSSSTLHILRDVICDVWDVSVNLINAFFSATATETTDLELSNESSPTDDNEADALDVSKYSLSISCICSFLAQLRALVTLGHAFESFVSNPNKINDEMQNTAHADYLLVGKKIDETYYQLCSNKSVLRFIQTRRDVSYTLSSIYTLHLQHQCYNEGKHSNKTTFTDKIIALYTSQCDNKGTINTSRTFSQQVLFIQSLARAINHVAKVDVRFGVELIYSLGVCWLRSYGHDNVQSVFAETISWLQSDGILDSVLSFDYKYISYSLVSPLINACADTTRDLMIDTDQATVFYILRNLFKAIGVSNFWFQIHENDSILLKCRIFVDICFAVKNHLGNQSILHEASEMIKELTKLDIYTMFYHVLIKEVSSETTEDALISGVYEQALAELCSIGTSIGANMTAFHQLNEDEKFHGMIQKCLRSLVWDLGGTTPQITASLKAIRVLCTLEQAKAMSYQASSATAKGSQSSQEITPIVSTDLQENVAVSFNNNFLYVMANVIEFEWIKRTDEQRSQSVRALTRLITLLLATDVKKFLPKIFTYIEKATESSSEGVIEDTVLLIDTMARSLSLEILGDGMIHLVVILFSVIEKRFIPTADEGITIDKHATIEMKQQVFTRVWKKRVLNTIVSVLQYILTQKAGDHEFMLSIGLVPSYVATATDIEKLQSEVLKKQSLNVTLKEYSSYLDHESSLVKTNILRKLSQLCRTHRSGIFTILQPLIAISAAGVSKEQSFAENSVLNLLKLLLGLTARDSNPSVLVECAKCIGELGAIDPSFIISQLSLQPTTGTNNEMKPWMFETLSTNSQELRPRFGIHLLVQYLVPGFKSTSSFQDRMGFAIQTILEIMKLAMQDNPVKSSAKGSVASKQSSKDREVPKALDAALTKFKIAQDTAPFFRTRYSLNDRNLIVQKPPFYTIKIENINFARWVGMWTRHLCMISTGPLMDYFQACRGAVRTRSDLCLFMLPYLIADVVSASDVASTGTPNDKFDHILLELCLVLADGDVSVLKEYSIKTTTNMVDEDGKTVSVQVDNDSVRFQGNDMAVQAVFEVLQKLSTWKTELERIRAENGRRPAPGSIASSNSRNSTPPFTQAMNSMLYGIKNLLSKIPKSLLGQAAYRTKAYASALKFFESHVRQQAVSNRATLTSISNNASSMYGERNDGSNFGLPLLSLSELDQFMAIYSELDDPDALQGFLVLRQIQGYPANYWTRIKEFEQTENWVAALNEYGAAHNQAFNTLSEENVETGATLVDMNTSTLAQSSSSSNAAMINSRTPFPSNQQQVPAHTTESGSNAALKRRLSFGIPASTNKSSSFFVDQTKVFSTPHSNRKRGTPHSGSSVKDNSKSKNPVSTLPSAKNGTSAQKGIQTAYGRSDRHSSMDNDNTVELDENDGDDDPQTDESLSLTKGRLRCLVELGHLDSVIEQAMLEVDPVEPELLALGIEASWRLSDWKSLDTLTQYSNSVLSSGSDARNVFAQTSIVGNVANLNEITVAESRGYSDRALKMPPETAFQIRLGKIVSSLHSSEQTKFYKELDLCRREIMQSLSAAFKESYGRTYPYIARLQILSELEDGWDILQQASIERKDERIKSLEWTNRMGLMSSSYQTISLTLATRRSVLSICGMRKAVTENWLDQCQSMRKMGRYDTARLALRMAESMDLGPYKQDIVLLEECQLLRCEGEINKALSLLEPIELNPYELSKNWSDITVVTHGRNLSAASRTLLDIKNDEKRKNLFARRLLMATQLMVENRQKHGKVIVERYNVYLNLQDKDDLVRFELGRYHESLYSEMKEKQAAPDSTTSERDIAAQEEASIGYVLDAIRSYARALQSGLVPIMTQALPRMLTLWFSTTWNRDVEEKKPSALRMQQEVSKLMSTEVFSNLSSYIWFHCMPQLVSRVGHKHKKTVVIITELLTRVLIAYPSNAIWHIAGLICSRHETRKSVVKNVMSKAISSLRESGRISEAKMLINSAGLFDQLEQLARLEKPESKKDMKIERNIGHNMDLSKFLVPTQQTLLLVAPRTNHSNSVSASSLVYHGSEDVYISRFDKEVEIQDTKAAPKTISIITSSGNKLKFLIKCEATGDLRKDARMMEFNSVFNRLLKEDSKGHKNNLRLRTYAVVCLNEECGIIEWVPNTTCLRHIINKSFSLSNGEFTPFRYDQTAFPKVMKSLQTKYVAKIDELVSEFKALVWDKTRPCFHLWFLDQFPDPTQWLEARTRFTRSAAVWSAVGHVIGLGDRHTQNILLDITNGECVHVDFDCIFDHGLTLPCPEIVPFRLSPNMIDAMGVTGIEGVFRNTMEMTMGLLRSNKDTLLSVLEPFLRDPTVHWDRGGKAQQGNNEPPRHVAASVDDMNVLAKDALLKVSGRLSGIYNITHPKADLIEEDCIVNERVVPTRGLGAAKDEGLSMSVSGQVKRIIDEAILIENLAQMFVGWEAWM